MLERLKACSPFSSDSEEIRLTFPKLIVGLGNPGTEYANTRHNAGEWFLETLAKQENLSLKKESKFHGYIARFDRGWLFKPSLYMNQSGRAVGMVANFYKIEPSEILVAHDELDFPVGVIRLKENGGHAGHNGLRNIIECLGTTDFYRWRIGIGHPGHKDRVTAYVLSAPSKSDQAAILKAIDEGIRVTKKWMEGYKCGF